MVAQAAGVGAFLERDRLACQLGMKLRQPVELGLLRGRAEEAGALGWDWQAGGLDLGLAELAIPAPTRSADNDRRSRRCC